MAALTAEERDCVDRFVAAARATLSGRLLAATLFGSAARGEMWPVDSPMHSDLDVLLLTAAPVPAGERATIVDATYPLFLECGRQISPQFFERDRWHDPQTSTERSLVDAVQREGITLYESS